MPLLTDFGFTPEQKMMRESLLKLAQKELPPELIRKLDEEAGWPKAAYDAMAKAGWLGLPYPEEYGGLGGSYKDLAVLLETLSYHYACLGTTYMTSVIYAGLQLLHNGSELLKREYMEPMIEGKIYLAFALTEPQTGSDAAAIKTHAVRKGSDYILTGQKWFITSAHMADHLVVVAKTNPAAQPVHNGFSIFLVDAKAKGVSMLPIRTMGRHTTHTNQIYFDEVRIPATHLIGEENRGWKLLMRGLDLERMAIAACGAGNAQHAIDIAQEYAMQRVQFGVPISKHQVIQHKIADMRIKAELARLVTYRTAEMMDAGVDTRMETAIAKIVATDCDFDCANIGMQVMGGAGYSMEHDMQRLFRDSRLGPLGGGSNEIQRNIISKLMGLS
jgi:alkylation response protein AidB-like acyl-CoA dehydrogenase